MFFLDPTAPFHALKEAATLMGGSPSDVDLDGFEGFYPPSEPVPTPPQEGASAPVEDERAAA